MLKLVFFTCACGNYEEDYRNTQVADDVKTMTCPDCGAEMTEEPWKANIHRVRIND